MGFIKGKKDQITIKTVADIDEDDGRILRVTWKTTWHKFKVSEAKRLAEDAKQPGFDDAEWIRNNLLGWSGLKDTDGNEVPFSRDDLEEMLDDREFKTALSQALIVAAFGSKAAEAKN